MFRNHQKGNVLVVVLFVIIVMGYLAASLARVGWSSHSAITKEFLGTKAWFTAQSSNDWVLTQLFPITDPVLVSDICEKINDGDRTPESGLFDKGCSIKEITCGNAGSLPSDTDAGDAVLYVFKSVASCGSGLSEVLRQQEVWVRE